MTTSHRCRDLIGPAGEHAWLVSTDRGMLVHIGQTGAFTAANLAGWTCRTEGGTWDGPVLSGAQAIVTSPEGREYDWDQHQGRSGGDGSSVAIGYLRPRRSGATNGEQS